MTKKSSKTILVVDDSPENIDVIRAILGDAYNLKTASDGDEALKVAFSKPPDLILLDIMMPKMDGYETARLLREEKSTQSIPIIFITSLEDSESKVRGFDVGANDYVTKPFDAAELTARVKTHLVLQDQRKQLASMNRLLERRVRQRTKKLEKSLEQKEVLLAELHHRVNNNFQIIISLLRLQLAFIKNRSVQAAFTEYLNRLQTISYAHENIGSEKDLLCVNFHQYLQKIVMHTLSNHRLNGKKVHTHIDTRGYTLNINVAVPCALIVQELISHIVQRQEESNGELNLTITLNRGIEAIYNLKIRCNANSTAEEIDFESRETFGFELIRVLMKQLGGSLHHHKTEDCYTLRFTNAPIVTYNPKVF